MGAYSRGGLLTICSSWVGAYSRGGGDFSKEGAIRGFTVCAGLWVSFEETCRIMGSNFGEILQNYLEGNLALTK